MEGAAAFIPDPAGQGSLGTLLRLATLTTPPSPAPHQQEAAAGSFPSEQAGRPRSEAGCLGVRLTGPRAAKNAAFWLPDLHLNPQTKFPNPEEGGHPIAMSLALTGPYSWWKGAPALPRQPRAPLRSSGLSMWPEGTSACPRIRVSPEGHGSHMRIWAGGGQGPVFGFGKSSCCPGKEGARGS